jgi:hypothetical protein
MTEDDAKTKWCPYRSTAAFQVMHLTVVAGGTGAVGAIQESNLSPTCAGSNCMMWRWERSEPTPTMTGNQHTADALLADKRYTSHPDAPGMFWKTGGDGHCGLAGKP